MATDASERSVTSPSRFTRQNSPPYPLHTKKGWGPQPNYKAHRRKIMFLPGSESNSSVVHPEAYSTLHHYPQSEKCEYAFILNKYAEHNPLWAANGRSPTQEILSLVQYPKDPYLIQDTALLCARWIQSTSSRLPSLIYTCKRYVKFYPTFRI
jgi:hypothetical protein